MIRQEQQQKVNVKHVELEHIQHLVQKVVQIVQLIHTIQIRDQHHLLLVFHVE